MADPSSSTPLLQRLGRVWLAYAKGQLLIALINGGLIGIVSAAIGLHFPLTLGAVGGILGLVPSIGPLLAAIPAVAVALWKGSTVIPVANGWFALITVGAYIALQQVVTLFIEPHLLGARLRLPPLIVFLGVIAGAALAGPLGALLAVPLIASLREVADYLRERRSPRP